MLSNSAALGTHTDLVIFTVELGDLLGVAWALLCLVPHLSDRHRSMSAHALGDGMSLGRRPHLHMVQSERRKEREEGRGGGKGRREEEEGRGGGKRRRGERGEGEEGHTVLKQLSQ